MHNYSPIQRLLHQLVLSSKIFKKTCFEFEKKIFLGDKCSLSDNHVFITGLARSGTTVFLNSIYESDKFASLTYRDMPFVLAPNYWSKINFYKHKNISSLTIRQSSQEEEIAPFLHSDLKEKLYYKIKNYLSLK